MDAARALMSMPSNLTDETLARDRAKRLWDGGQNKSLEPNPRGWAIWIN